MSPLLLNREGESRVLASDLDATPVRQPGPPWFASPRIPFYLPFSYVSCVRRARPCPLSASFPSNQNNRAAVRARFAVSFCARPIVLFDTRALAP